VEGVDGVVIEGSACVLVQAVDKGNAVKVNRAWVVVRVLQEGVEGLVEKGCSRIASTLTEPLLELLARRFEDVDPARGRNKRSDQLA